MYATLPFCKETVSTPQTHDQRVSSRATYYYIQARLHCQTLSALGSIRNWQTKSVSNMPNLKKQTKRGEDHASKIRLTTGNALGIQLKYQRYIS